MPDRPKHVQIQRLIDLTGGKVPYDWISISLQRIAPLRQVLLGLPSVLIVGDVAFGAFFKGHLPRRFRLSRTLLCVSNLNGVLAVLSQSTAGRGLFSRACQPRRRVRTESHLALALVDLITEYPGLGVVLTDLKVQTAAISVSPRRQFSSDLQRLQHMEFAQLNPRSNPRAWVR